LNNGFRELSAQNLVWFWTKFRNNTTRVFEKEYLTERGAQTLYKVAVSPTYDFFKQPTRIQNRILKMLETAPTGREYAWLLEGCRDKPEEKTIFEDFIT